MKRYVITGLLFFLFSIIGFAQKFTPEIICSSDTLVIEPIQRKYIKDSENERATQSSYKAVRCTYPSAFAVRFDVGISRYYYNEDTKNWIGNHFGPNFGASVSYNKFSFGGRFKPWTVNPLKEIDFQGNVLPKNANLNPIKLDLYLGYSFDFDHLISIEPQIGYTKSMFFVINEDQLQQNYWIKENRGLLLAMSLNKYFKFNNYDFLAIFANFGYATNDFTKTHPDLGKGYFEWTIGFSTKSFYRSKKIKRVE